MTTRDEREARRYRGGETRRRGRTDDTRIISGHPALFSMTPALEMGVMPEGGGYPWGFPEAAARLMGVDLADVVHLCSGSVAGGRATIDARAEVLPKRHPNHADGMRPSVCADVRWLPLGAGTVDAILVDPPYDPNYAEDLWQLGRIYPTPSVIMRECATVLRPGGRVGLLHHLMPAMVPGLRRLGTYGVTTGENYRIRAFTVAERTLEPTQLAPMP